MKEIERKFLVKDDLEDYLVDINGMAICQGYLSVNEEATVRIRIKDKIAYLTIKSKTIGFARDEFEYEIPVLDAKQMLLLCGQRRVVKKRYIVPYEGKEWEVDIFEGKHLGLKIAEIELQSEGEKFQLPPWVDSEVSKDHRYFNSNLALHDWDIKSVE